jgi:hypothetical protein
MFVAFSSLAGLYPFAQGIPGKFTEKKGFTLNKMHIYGLHKETKALQK